MGKDIIKQKDNYMKNTKFLVSVVLVLAAVLLSATAITLSLVLNKVNHIEKEENYHEYSLQLINGSGNLTYYAYQYIITQDEEHYNKYLNELEESKKREDAINEILEQELSGDNELVVEAIDCANALKEQELLAFKYLNQGDVEKARDIVYSDEYNSDKERINQIYSELRNQSVSEKNSENKSIVDVTYITFIITIIVAIGMVIAVGFLVVNFIKAQKNSDIDELTGLNNRNNYKQYIQEIIKEQPNKYGALIFCDIDNLKFINDYYGHRNGDKYIQAMAEYLKTFKEYLSFVCRLAGDEFIVYIHGFETQEEVKNAVIDKINKGSEKYFVTSLNITERLRFTSGISIYPSDSEDIEELLKYSDYSMLKMKKSSKGEMFFYDKAEYDRSMFLLTNRGYLDDFLEKEELDFVMQPIVHTQTFEIYGYEALMRPYYDMINTPFLLLQIAKEESKLDKVEKLVLRKVFEKINSNMEQLGTAKVFVNSIADRVLSDEELDEFITKYPDLLQNVVIEVTEQEYVDEEVLKMKIDTFKKLGAIVALDDYGSGYSNEFVLLSGLYDIIKIDMKIIRNIDHDIKRQEIVKSIMKVSRISGYKVLAEGVETEAEVKILRELGVHYLQGFFIGRPNREVVGVRKDALAKLDSNYNWID